MENCFIDAKNNIKIPQNDNTLILIKKSEKWNFAISIELNLKEDLNYFNIFLIIKSYCYTNICKTYAICTLFKKTDSKLVVSSRENINSLKNMDYDQFKEWLNFRIQNDWEYNKSSNFYSILILFEKNLVKLQSKELIKKNIEEDVLKFLKPIYPWTEKWINFFEKSLEEKDKLKILLEFQKKIIIKQKKHIYLLKKLKKNKKFVSRNLR